MIELDGDRPSPSPAKWRPIARRGLTNQSVAAAPSPPGHDDKTRSGPRPCSNRSTLEIGAWSA